MLILYLALLLNLRNIIGIAENDTFLLFNIYTNETYVMTNSPYLWKVKFKSGNCKNCSMHSWKFFTADCECEEFVKIGTYDEESFDGIKCITRSKDDNYKAIEEIDNEDSTILKSIESNRSSNNYRNDFFDDGRWQALEGINLMRENVTMNNLKTSCSNDAGEGLVLVEDELNGLSGSMEIMKYNELHKFLPFCRISTDDFKHLLLRTSVNGNYSVQIYKRERNAKNDREYVRNDDNRNKSESTQPLSVAIAGIANRLRKRLAGRKLERKPRRKVSYAVANNIHMADLESCLNYMFRVEIPNKPFYSSQEQTALINWLSVLFNFFDGRDTTLKFFRKMKKKLSSFRSLNATGNQVGSIFRENTLDYFLTNEIKWVHCKETNEYVRGYPCALWLLFHYLTVNFPETDQNPGAIISAIHSYVNNFFDCRQCVINYRNEINQMNRSIDSKDDIILYMWKVHNRFNIKLAEDRIKPGMYPKSVFPTLKQCRQCHLCKNLKQGKRNYELDSCWNLTEVVKFLKRTYGKAFVNDSGLSSFAANAPISIQNFWYARLNQGRMIKPLTAESDNKSQNSAKNKPSVLKLIVLDLFLITFMYLFMLT